MTAPGDKAKLVTALDNRMAEDLVPLYSIEVMLGKSPKLGVKCGVISIFKLNQIDLDFETTLNPHRFDPHIAEKIQEMEKDISKQTETMHMDPIYFKETEGRWISWAIDRALALYDQVGGSASVSVLCPQLNIKRRRPSKDVASLRSNPKELFPEASDIDRLLDSDYEYDPWTQTIRRGKINAKMAKR